MPAQEELKLFSACQADLGESPVWDEAHQCLLFVDISGGQINALDQHGRLTRLYESPARIGALALTEKGNLIFSQNAGVAILDRTSLRVTQNSKLAITLSSYRFNDGACDPQGRFITGLMDEGHSAIRASSIATMPALTPRSYWTASACPTDWHGQVRATSCCS